MSQSVDNPVAAPTSVLDVSDHHPQNPSNATPSLSSFPWISTWLIILSLSATAASILTMTTPVGGRQGPAHGFFLPVLAAAICILAALFDAWTARIPNQLTYTAILLGLLLNGLTPLLDLVHANTALLWLGAAGPASSLLGFAACAGLGLLGALLAGVHGGDLKLLAALGALLGLTQTGNILIVALTIAIFYAAINLLLFGRLNTILRLAAMQLLELLYFRRIATPIPEDLPRTSHIPMAIPLALGLIIAQFWQFRTGGGGIL